MFPVGSTAVLMLAVLVAWLLPAATARAKTVPCGHSTWAPSRLSLRQMRQSELCLINRIRAHYHLHKLDDNSDLQDSAIGHSDSMVAHRYFAHEGPGGSVDSRITRAGYLARARAFTLGENIGGGHGRRWGSPMAVFEAWMHSPPHRENILDPSVRWIGVANAMGGGAVWNTVDFVG